MRDFENFQDLKSFCDFEKIMFYDGGATFCSMMALHLSVLWWRCTFTFLFYDGGAPSLFWRCTFLLFLYGGAGVGMCKSVLVKKVVQKGGWWCKKMAVLSSKKSLTLNSG